MFIGLNASLVAFGQSSEDTLQLNEVVITGTRFATPIEKSAKSIYKIDSAELSRAGGKSVADLLNQVPGLHMIGNFGTPGTNISYTARGGRSKSVLVLIDGLPINDPTQISAAYDLRFLSTDQVKSIEVLNGGLSSLYGSNASAGVINIKMKSSYKNDGPMAGRVGLEYGSYHAFKQNAQIHGGTEGLSYFVSAANLQADGFSAAKDTESLGFDDDGISRQNVLLKLGYDFNNHFSLRFRSSYNRFRADVDDGAFADNDTAWVEGKQLTFGLTPTYNYDHGKITLKAAYATNENDSRTSYPTLEHGRNLQVDLTEEHYFTPAIKALAGVNVQRLAYDPDTEDLDFEDANFTILDPYASVVYEGKAVNVQGGIRFNTHSEYDSKLIYNTSAAYLFDFPGPKLKLRAGLSSAYITPTLYQLYSVYGNTKLNAEESLNYEAGFSLYLFDSRLAFNAVAFERHEKELIDFVPLYDNEGNYMGGEYQNIQDERFVKGLEFQLNWSFIEALSLSANYTYSRANKDDTFYRIPENKWGAGVNVKPLDNMNVSLTYLNTGERTDFDYITYSEITFDNYSLIDLYIDYVFINKLRLSGAVNNIADEGFTGVYGYSVRGRNYYIGFSYMF